MWMATEKGALMKHRVRIQLQISVWISLEKKGEFYYYLSVCAFSENDFLSLATEWNLLYKYNIQPEQKMSMGLEQTFLWLVETFSSNPLIFDSFTVEMEWLLTSKL